MNELLKEILKNDNFIENIEIKIEKVGPVETSTIKITPNKTNNKFGAECKINSNLYTKGINIDELTEEVVKRISNELKKSLNSIKK